MWRSFTPPNIGNGILLTKISILTKSKIWNPKVIRFRVGLKSSLMAKCLFTPKSKTYNINEINTGRIPFSKRDSFQLSRKTYKKYPLFSGFYYGFLSDNNVFYPWRGKDNTQELNNGFLVDPTDTTPTGWMDIDKNLLKVGDNVIVGNGGLKRGIVESCPPYWHHMGCGWCILIIKVRLTKTNKLVTIKNPKHIIKA
jgi:hypothetical protein